MSQTGTPAAKETLLVVRKSSGALDFIDTATGQRLKSVDVGEAPHEVSVSPDGRRAVVSNFGTLEKPGSTLRVVDLGRAAVTATIEIAPHSRPHGLAWVSSERIVATAESSCCLLNVHLDEGRVASSIETGQEHSHMVAVSRDGSRAYVANIGSGSLSLLDLTAGSKLEDLPTGPGSEGVALTPDGREVWVCARGVNRLAIVATDSAALVGSIAVPAMPIRVVFEARGRLAYVSCAAAGELISVDVATRQIVARHTVRLPLAPDAPTRQFAHLAPGGPLPIGLAVSPTGQALYLASTMADRVEVLDPDTLETRNCLQIGGEPDGLAVLPA